MNEPNPGGGSEGGWNAARILGMIVGLIGMLGFGFCSLCGIVMGLGDHQWLGVTLMFSVPGLIITALFVWLMRTILRRANREP